MNDHELLTLRQVADALGVTTRRVRSWADAGTIDFLQNGFHSERLVPARELRRFERLGYRVRWTVLVATSATSANLETLSIEG